MEHSEMDSQKGHTPSYSIIYSKSNSQYSTENNAGQFHEEKPISKHG